LLGLLLVAAGSTALLVQSAQADPGAAAGDPLKGKRTPTITGFTPVSGPAGTSVVVSGSNFAQVGRVSFNRARAGFTVDSPSQITATVPAGATTGPITIVTAAGAATSRASFTVTAPAPPAPPPPAPTVTGFSPTSGAPGTAVEVTGTNLGGATNVAFNGATASYTVDSPTQITATVPSGATKGPIRVTTGGGAATTASAFTVTIADAPTAIFVSPTGSDTTGDGSIAKPFATLGKAQATMRAGGPQTTYVRAGFYSLPAVTQNGVTYGLRLTAADNGQTWSYYPPDGYGSAILDGGSTSATTGIKELVTLDGASHVTIDGLQLQHFRWIGVGVHGGGGFYELFPGSTTAADGNSITDNVIHDGAYDLGPVFGYGGGGFYSEGNTPNLTVANNVVSSVSAFGIEAQAGNAGQGGNVSSLRIANNVLLSTCQLENDCGAIYVQDKNTTSTGIRIDNNYVRDTGYPAYPARPIYLDDGVSGATVTHNVIAAGLYIWAFTIHGGRNDTFSSNIVDLGGGNNREILLYEGDGLTGMAGNALRGNLIVSGGGGGGYEGRSFDAQPTIANNAYHQYGGSSIYTGGYTGLTGDSSPALQDPQMSCWTYDLAGSSPVYGAPTVFDALPRGWGPPGYAISEVGTPPSQPHSC
jgi:uncharacterized protein (TIGR03437 family)